MKAILLVPALLLSASVSLAADDPYELETGREVAVIGGAAAAFLVGWAANALPDTALDGSPRPVPRLPGLDRGAVRRWSHAAAQASDGLQFAIVLTPLALVMDESSRGRGGTTALMYAETMLLNNGVTFALKNLVRRPRPYVHNPDPRIPAELRVSPTAYRSFPSGHTSNAFAAMVFLATTFERIHPDSGARGWVWGGGLAAAATTGWLRYAAGRHYPTDILAGALLGAAAGWLVPLLHETDAAAPSGGAKLAWGFAF